MKNVSAKNLITFVMLFAFCTMAIAKKKEHKEAEEAKPATGFSPVYTKVIQRGQRFENPAYFNLMASDGIRKVDARALYERLQVAVAANERYKALYLARVFTQLKPDAAAAWSNRAQLASALGLTEEASACEQNAKDPAHPIRVPLTGILPGSGLKTKPADLSDWAAATALLSDGIAEKEGKQALIAYKDLVSGVHQATDDEVAERTRSFQADGLAAPGPWANPEPVQLRHVLANVFDLLDAEPMRYNSGSKAGFMGAMVMAGVSGMQQNTNPAASQQGWDLAQQMAGRASQVPSDFKGGKYTRVTFADGKEVATPDHPQSSGESETVNKPVPFLWASGGSTEPYLTAHWNSSMEVGGKKITISNLADIHNPHAKRYNPPSELQFPKLMTLCLAQAPKQITCSIPLSLMELLLTPDDVAHLATDLAGILGDLTFFSKAYDTDALLLQGMNGTYTDYCTWGADKEGDLFLLHAKPTAWMTAAR